MKESRIILGNTKYIVRRSSHDKSVLFELLDLHDKSEISRIGLFRDNNTTATVLLLNVSEEYRGKGIAKNFLTYCSDIEGIDRIIGTSLNKSVSFWEHIGATFIEGRDFELYLRQENKTNEHDIVKTI